MKKKKFASLRHFFEGMCLGVTLLAPGLSVATIAMILGIYEQLLDLVNDFFSSKWKETLKSLIPLGLGAVMALMASSRTLAWAIDNHPYQTYFLFLGLVIGAIPLLLKTSDAKNTFKTKHIIPLVVVAILTASIAFLDIPEADHVVQQLNTGLIIRLAITGALASSAMLLPGLSASLMLLLMGTYNMLTHAISELNLPIIGIVIMGMLAGLIISGRGIKFLLTRYMDFTYAVSIGMVLGSIVVIYEMSGFPSTIEGIITSLITFAIGLISVIVLDRQKK